MDQITEHMQKLIQSSATARNNGDYGAAASYDKHISTLVHIINTQEYDKVSLHCQGIDN